MLKLLKKKPADPIGYMEAKEASEIMEQKRAAAARALQEYKQAKRDYHRIYTILMTSFKTPANDRGV